MKPKHIVLLILVAICFEAKTTFAQQQPCDAPRFIELYDLGKAQLAKKDYANAIKNLDIAGRICPRCSDCKAMIAACKAALAQIAKNQVAATKAEKERIAKQNQEAADKAEKERIAKQNQEAADKAETQRLKDKNAALELQLSELKNSKPMLPAQATTPTNGQVKQIAHGIKLVYVQGGSFMMGSNKGDANASDDEMVNGKKHQVTVVGFWIGQTEVTQAQWRAVMGNNPLEPYNTGRNNYPVGMVSWNDTQDFLKKLGSDYRLPTEAEWEYAARGGTKWVDNYVYAGSNDIGSVAWYYKNSKRITKGTTHPVATKAANQLGLYDMSGNVWEWCADWIKGYPGSSGVSDHSNSNRVLRGGSWPDDPKFSRVAHRQYQNPEYRTSNYGFRFVLSQ